MDVDKLAASIQADCTYDINADAAWGVPIPFKLDLLWENALDLANAVLERAARIEDLEATVSSLAHALQVAKDQAARWMAETAAEDHLAFRSQGAALAGVNA